MAVSGMNIQVLWRIMQALEGEQVEGALTDALEEVTRVISVESAAIWLKNDASKHIHSILSVGEANIAGFSIDVGQGIIGAACEAQEPISINDVLSDERFPGGKDEITGIEVNNVFLMPMILRKETVGCVELINRDKEAFSEDEISLIHSFAGLIALFLNERGYDYAPDTEKKVVMSLRGITKDYPSGMDVVHILKGVDLDIY